MNVKRIAVNCWVLRNRQLDGIGNYTVQTLGDVIRNHPEWQFDILVDRRFVNQYFTFPNVKLHYIFPPYRHPLLYVIYLEIILPIYLRKLRPSVVISPDGLLSLCSSYDQIPIIHDLNFEHYPENLPWRNRIYYRFFFSRFARKAACIATVSEYTKNDIIKTYGISNKKIDNISAGISSYFYLCTDDEKKQVKTKYTNGSEYFFFAGTMHPRKNIPGLIKAFTLFRENNKNDMKLLLAGHIMWDDNTIKNLLDNNPYKKDIILAGRVSDEELRLLLGSAWALVFVPMFEGFGLPIVEAWKCGIPVICSNVTSMPEVAGNAAITVDPFNTIEIAGAMQKMTDPLLREKYIQLGQNRKDFFSWERTAKLLWEVIEKLLVGE